MSLVTAQPDEAAFFSLCSFILLALVVLLSTKPGKFSATVGSVMLDLPNTFLEKERFLGTASVPFISIILFLLGVKWATCALSLGAEEDGTNLPFPFYHLWYQQYSWQPLQTGPSVLKQCFCLHSLTGQWSHTTVVTRIHQSCFSSSWGWLCWTSLAKAISWGALVTMASTGEVSSYFLSLVTQWHGNGHGWKWSLACPPSWHWLPSAQESFCISLLAVQWMGNEYEHKMNLSHPPPWWQLGMWGLLEFLLWWLWMSASTWDNCLLFLALRANLCIQHLLKAIFLGIRKHNWPLLFLSCDGLTCLSIATDLDSELYMRSDEQADSRFFNNDSTYLELHLQQERRLKGNREVMTDGQYEKGPGLKVRQEWKQFEWHVKWCAHTQLSHLLLILHTCVLGNRKILAEYM